MEHPFLEAISRGAVLADGAIGTLLRERGWRAPYELAAIEAPDLVRAIHQDYIAAGADLILTNTFEANRAILTRHGLGAQVHRANTVAARLARDAREISGQSVFIGGSIGPIGRELAIGALTLADAFTAHREQAEALVEGGVDVFVLETFPGVREVREAIRAVRSVTDLPVVAMLDFNADLASTAGETPAEIARLLAEAGADVVGVNCGVGPQAALDMVEQMAREPAHPPLAIQPNGGLPRQQGGARVYPATPDYFADFALRARDLGAIYIGGCCGTTPEHIRSMRTAIGRVSTFVYVGSGGGRVGGAADVVFVPRGGQEPLGEDEAAPTQAEPALRDKLAARRYVISVEIDPPRGVTVRKALEGAVMLKAAGADAINIGDSPMARVRMGALGLGVLIQQRAGIEAIIHQTTRDRNLMALQADMLSAYALGLRNVIALGGDPPPEASQSSAVWDVDSIDFIRVLKRLNDGVDFAGNSIGGRTDFWVAVAANPTADDVDLELRRVRQKIEAGADMLMTQPVYDSARVTDFFDRLAATGPIDVPVLLGIMPLVSYRNAEFVHNELAGVVVPAAIRARMQRAGEAGTAEGIAIAIEHIEETRALPFVSGIYVMPAFGRYEIAAEVVRYVASVRG
ncbi:MAG: bifunctional homocysteine S-methyltransferase/methylenetetrahydrofolate reductase [Dehalococcoidia bacterium]|nr:bifunctional homocysteine S-methyltransferase/methylenetetrahydrofolate reductase [Dehalococcoidia bacterium]